MDSFLIEINKIIGYEIVSVDVTFQKSREQLKEEPRLQESCQRGNRLAAIDKVGRAVRLEKSIVLREIVK